MTIRQKKSEKFGKNSFKEKPMTHHRGNRPAEVFGFSIHNRSPEAQSVRNRYWCPFADAKCYKISRLINYPFGVCTVQHHDEFYSVCPRRFREQGSIEGTPQVLEEIASHYFGDLSNVIYFPEVRLPNIGSIDFVLVRHKPMKAEVDDFVPVEFQTDSTSGTGQLVKGLQDFMEGQNIEERKYAFGINTYDTIKRSMTQLFNKGLVYEGWGVKGYWVIQEYIYANLVKRYGLKASGYSPEHASRFALYNLIQQEDRLALVQSRWVSTTVDEVYQAMRKNPALPDKDTFVGFLNVKLRAKLQLKFDD
jgi:hypothetical protein